MVVVVVVAVVFAVVVVVVVVLLVVVVVVVVVVVCLMTEVNYISSFTDTSKMIEKTVFTTFDIQMCFAPQRRAPFRQVDDIGRSKSGPSMWCLVHFHFHMCFVPQRLAFSFNISTSKSGTRPTCFATFYFQMCFEPQRRALFGRHREVQKWSKHVVLCTCSLPHVLRAA